MVGCGNDWGVDDEERNGCREVLYMFAGLRVNSEILLAG